MSLLVWLPLNGNLNNLGLGTITSVNGTPSFKTSGKISNNALDLKTRITFICPLLANLLTFSIAFWAMVQTSDTLTSSWQDVMGFTDISSSGSNGNFRWETTYSSSNLGIHWHDNATNALVNGSHNHNTVKELWVHCCVVFDQVAGKLYSYDNGIKTLTHNHLNGKFNSTGTFYLGETNNIEGMIQDVRIYDHALSDKEVEEISKGLVLHYKLDDIINKNFYTGNGITTLHNTSSVSNNGYESTFVLNAAGSARVSNLGFNGKTGPWVASFDIKCNVSTTIAVDICDKVYNIATYGVSLVANEWTHKSFIITTATNLYNTSSDNYNGFIDFNGGAAGTYELKNLKVEEGICETAFCNSEYNENIIYDSSGYNNNGTIVGTLTVSENTSKYKYSTIFDGNTAAIQTPNLKTMITDKTYTISCWTYKILIGSKNYQTIYGGPGGFELEARSSSTTSPLFRIHNWGGGTTPYEFGLWYHFCFVHTDDNSKLYINGELKITGTSANIPSGNYFIGAWNTSSLLNYDGNISDFRIYATALTLDLIKELYNTSVTIDNKNNIYARELVEQ